MSIIIYKNLNIFNLLKNKEDDIEQFSVEILKTPRSDKIIQAA